MLCGSLGSVGLRAGYVIWVALRYCAVGCYLIVLVSLCLGMCGLVCCFASLLVGWLDFGLF